MNYSSVGSHTPPQALAASGPSRSEAKTAMKMKDVANFQRHPKMIKSVLLNQDYAPRPPVGLRRKGVHRGKARPDIQFVERKYHALGPRIKDFAPVCAEIRLRGPTA